MSDAHNTNSSSIGIFVNQAGYRPEGPKKAVLPFSCEEYKIIDTDGRVRFSGMPSGFGFDKASGDNVYIADFSRFSDPGQYRIIANGTSSALFSINDRVYERVLDSTLKAFYYQRCGCALDRRYAGIWPHDACHTEKARLWEDSDIEVDITGGWHDAGDFGRYVTPGAVAAAHLLYAYKLFPGVLEGRRYGIPADGELPDALAEVKYELEWLMKMQRADGAVYHKATSALHPPFVMPEKDKSTIYLFPCSSMAAADLAAVCALASGIYRPFDREFAYRLLVTAERSGEWLIGHPEFLGFTNPEECNTGLYGQHSDISNRFWAFTELYSVTGDKKYLDLINPSVNKDFSLTELGHAETGGLGSLAYILCPQPKDKMTGIRLKSIFYGSAAALKGLSEKSGYGTAVSPEHYYWGSNMQIMKNAMIFALNDVLNGDPRSRDCAARQLDYLLGANPLGISYVTGTGEYRCSHPHLRTAACDGVDECIPGFVAGGPNRHPADTTAIKSIEHGTPPAKCYIDNEDCYSLNEVAIYWNSATVFVLAYLCGK